MDDSYHRKQIAIHEAAHFVVADKLGLPVHSITTQANSQERYEGKVSINLRDQNGNVIEPEQCKDRETRRNWAITCYAGDIAQRRIIPSNNQNWWVWTMHQDEKAQAAKLCARICSEELGLNGNEPKVSSEIEVALDKRTSDLVDELERRAEQIVNKNWTAVERLANAIEKPCTMPAEQARQVAYAYLDV